MSKWTFRNRRCEREQGSVGKNDSLATIYEPEQHFTKKGIEKARERLRRWVPILNHRMFFSSPIVGSNDGYFWHLQNQTLQIIKKKIVLIRFVFIVTILFVNVFYVF